MIKNMVVEDLLINTVFRVISLINRMIPKDENRILLYSDMGFRDNIKSIYDYMIDKGYNQKYTIIRSQKEHEKGKLPVNVKVAGNISGILCYLRCGHVFYAFGKLPIYPRKGQRVVQMWHGAPFKGIDIRQKKEHNGNRKRCYYTNVLVTGEVFSSVFAGIFSCDKKTISICGQPRTDMMVHPYEIRRSGCKKLVLWLPTFRKSEALGYCDSSTKSILPVIKESELPMLDELLGKMEMILYVKLHPLQDCGEWEKKENPFRYIYIRSHGRFSRDNLDLYRLLGCADALITDYSSVFYDYMLMNRPIGFTEDDIKEYNERRGFVVDDPDYFKTGARLNTYDGIVEFLQSVADGRDEWKEKREKVNREVNYYRDFDNRKRALNIGGVYYNE